MQLTARDFKVLRWILRHGVVTANQVRRDFFPSQRRAYGRLRDLGQAGLLTHRRVLYGEPGVYRATERGAELADIGLTPGRLRWPDLEHSLSVVDLSQDLLRENPGARWVTEREIRRDSMEREYRDPESGKLVAVADQSRDRRPDGLLIQPGGRMVAVEYEQTPKRSGVYEKLVEDLATKMMLGEYFDRVLFVFKSERPVERLQEIAESWDSGGEYFEFRVWERPDRSLA